MTKKGAIYCFYADYQESEPLNKAKVPEWLNIEANWRGYRIMTLPWIADVASILGLLTFENTQEAWKDYLETLGFQKVTPVCCETFYEDKLYS